MDTYSQERESKAILQNDDEVSEVAVVNNVYKAVQKQIPILKKYPLQWLEGLRKTIHDRR
jgi:hypothetical protein